VDVTRLSRRRSRPEHAVVAEDSLPAAQDDGVDHQPVAVDEIVLDERGDQLGAADHVEVAAVFPLQRRHRLGGVAREQGRRSATRAARRGSSRRRTWAVEFSGPATGSSSSLAVGH
jgi:hypothetical protein